MRCSGNVVGTYSKTEARVLKRPEIAGHKKRAYCGYSVAGLIAKVPTDGKVHKLKCPQCGNVMTVRKTPEAEPAPEG